MKAKVVCAVMLVSISSLFPPWTLAKDPPKNTPQQARMSECAAESKGMKGAEHKKFMSECLKGKEGAAAKPATQQEKMKTCNVEAGKKKLKGDEHKAFMSDCLKG